MYIETGLVVSAVAGGAIADRCVVVPVKEAVGKWLGKAHLFDWHNFTAQRAWLVYTMIFGEHSRSLRFISRSFLLYTGLCLASLVFLYFAFPLTFAAAVSVWRFGAPHHQAWWLLAMVAGGALYVLANAQTLYFLEILKTAPNFFRFFLVAYADFLITASIALFGVPLLLTMYTLGVVTTGGTSLELRINFQSLNVNPLQETVRALAPNKSGNVAPKEDPNEFTVRFEFVDPRINMAAMQADYEAIYTAIRQGVIKGETTPKGNGLILYNDRGGMVLIQEMGKPFKGEVTSYLGFTHAVANPNEAFCVSFARSPNSQLGSRVVSPKTEEVSAALLAACRNKESAVVTVPVRINSANVLYNLVYKKYLFATLNDLVNSVSSGFHSYLILSPYAVFPDDLNIWEDKIWKRDVYGDYKDNPGGRLFDEAMFKAYMQGEGANNVVNNSGLAAGTINFAIMSTAAFNLVVMSIFFVLFPLIKLLPKVNVVGRYLSFQTAPFTLIGGTIAIWLAAIIAVASALS
jgi:hypothetical protein